MFVSRLDEDSVASLDKGVKRHYCQLMSKIDQIRELSAKGLPARAIAAELGITRAWVYQICKTNGIRLNRYTVRDFFKDARCTPTPRPRVITGGIPVKVNHSVVGTISELLAAADLMARGWMVYMPIYPSKGHDIIAIKDEIVLMVEVRSAYRNGSGRLIFTKKPDCKSGTYALVVTGEPVSYEPPID